MLITIVLWFQFFRVVKSTDTELYEKIKFNWSFKFFTPYGDYIFKKEFVNSSNAEIIKYAKVLYYVGNIGQWAFNIYMLLMVIFLIRQVAN